MLNGMKDDYKPQAFKVLHVTGVEKVFTNANNIENYTHLLLSGAYAIMLSRGPALTLTPETVVSITQVCSGCHDDYELHTGVNVCPKCGERTFVGATEN